MKKFLKEILLTCISIAAVTNMAFAEIWKTSYDPTTESAVGSWARQPDNAPWCMLTCTKIVLKDILEKQFHSGYEYEYKRDIMKKIVPLLTKDGLLEQVLLNNKASLDTIDNITKFPNSEYLMKMPIECMFNKCIIGRIRSKTNGMEFKKRLETFDGLLTAASTDILSSVWNSLEDNAKKLIKQTTDNELLDIVENITSLQWEYHGVDATAHDDVVNYKTAIDNIAEEIYNKRMAILIFEDTTKPNETHACIATKSVENGGTHINIITVYNPWGCYQVISANPRNPYTSQKNDGLNDNVNPLIKIAKPPFDKETWQLRGYYTFTY